MSGISLFPDMFGSGDHDGYHFVVYECCSTTLRDVLVDTLKYPLPRRHVQEVAFQLIQGVDCMFDPQSFEGGVLLTLGDI